MNIEKKKKKKEKRKKKREVSHSEVELLSRDLLLEILHFAQLLACPISCHGLRLEKKTQSVAVYLHREPLRRQSA